MLSAVRVSSNCEAARSVLSASLQSLRGRVVDGNECGLLPETSPIGSSVGIGAGDAFESNPVSLRPDHDRMYRDLCQSVRQTLADGYTMDDLLEGLAHEDTLERLNQSQIGPVVDGNECGLLPETTPSPTGSSVGIVAGDAFESNPVSLRPDHDRMYRDLRQSVRQTLADGNAMDGMPEGLVHKERLERLKDNVRTFIQESMTAMTYDQKQDLLSMYREKYNRIDDLIQKRVSCAAQPKKRSLFGRVFGKNRKDLPKDDVEETRILETQNILNLLTLQVIASNTSSIF